MGNPNHILEADLPVRANRETRRACKKIGHRWNRYGDGTVRCGDCGEVSN